MNSLQLPTKACWDAGSASKIFKTEALTGNDALFLATHTRISGFSISGPEAASVEETNEASLLAAISKEGLQHAFVAIEGEPGSGKSHLIRWLGLNWPKNDTDIPLLLQRSDGSLEGALEQLKEKLPPEFADLFANMGSPQNIALSGRIRLFFNNLQEKLRDDHYEEQLEDIDWIRRWQPEGLLSNPKIKEEWTAPGRILEIIQGAEGERNSEAARFKISDVAEIIDLTDKRTCPPRSIKLREKLFGEWLEYSELLEEGHDDNQIISKIGEDISKTREFLESLNRRLNDAIQTVIGVSANDLKKLFKDVRTELAKRNQRLVLLLEDITSWQGLDHGLIDVLVTDAGTRQQDDGGSDVCALVSVVGLTPDYVRELRGNYRDRVTHWIHLGESGASQHDIATLQDADKRKRFVSKYLAATRAGIEKVGQWYDDRIEGDEPPNPCLNCTFRSSCHQAFGEVDGVGLFPFTPEAIETFYEALVKDEAGHTRKTPRGLIQAVLKPTLDTPQDIERKQYPGPAIERPALELRPWGSAQASIIGRLEIEAAESERLKRFLSLWGENGSLATEGTETTELVFDGIRRSVFDCFDLPWPGSDEAEPLPAKVVGGKGEEPDPPNEPEGGGNQPRGPTRSGGAQGPKIHPPEPRRKRGEYDPRDIEKWRNEGKLQNATVWGRVLYDIIRKIDHRSLGFDPYAWNVIFTESTIRFEGMAQPRRGSLMIPPEDWVKDGLEAYAYLSDKDGLSSEQIEFYTGRLARLYDRLEVFSQEFATSRVGQTDAGSIWRPAISAMQVLLVRSWLRGTVSPTAPDVEQWQALFADEEENATPSGARTEKWRAFLQATNARQRAFRDILRRTLSIPQGTSRDFGLASGEIARPLIALCREHEFQDLSEQMPDQLDGSPFEPLSEIATQARDNLSAAMREEKELLTERTARSVELLRRQSPAAHILRVDNVIEDVSAKLPDAAPDPVDAWKRSLADYRPLMIHSEYQEKLIDTLGEFSDPSDLPSDKAELLNVLVTAQSYALNQILEILKTGEAALVPLSKYVQSIVGTDVGGVGDLKEVVETAKRVNSAAEALYEVCQDRSA